MKEQLQGGRLKGGIPRAHLDWVRQQRGDRGVEEVLARLLELNAERGKAEARAGSGGPTAGSVTKPSKGGSSAKKDSKRKPKDSKTRDLL